MLFAHKIVWGVLFISVVGTACAQVVIPPDRNELAEGKSTWTLIYAEANGLPGPREVLRLQDKLALTRDQIKKAEALEKVTSSSARAKGEEIILEEESLFNMFEAGSVSEKNLRSKLERCAKLRADMQFVHLQSHLRMKQVLTPEQLQKYKTLKADEK
ncbi:MAG: hypothetical protein V1799_10605 [bacterium]